MVLSLYNVSDFVRFLMPLINNCQKMNAVMLSQLELLFIELSTPRSLCHIHRKSVSEGECPVIRAPDFDVYIVIYRKLIRVDEGHGFAL